MLNDVRIRRRDLCLGGFLLAGLAPRVSGQRSAPKNDEFRSLFDGVSLHGWNRQTRILSQPSVGKWTVEDGAIIGGQDPPGVGSYLVTDDVFDDFELQIEARPDWPVDTGILVRTVAQGNIGFQVLLDHRPHGGIGGYYGNGLAGIHAYEYAFSAELDKEGHVARLIPEKPSEPTLWVPLDFAAPVKVFLKAWKVNDWNQFRIRSVGALPYLTTWINGEKISELDTSKVEATGWDPKRVLERIGRAGHIALEVHNNDARLGLDRWGPGKVCRWRNISIKKLSA